MNDNGKINRVMQLLKKAPNDEIRLELLELLFTPTELDQLAARYDIIMGLISENITQRELSANLKLSIAKITRGSNELKRVSPALRMYLRKFLSKS